MNLKIRNFCLTGSVVFLLSSVVNVAPADQLVTTEGDILSGTVTKTASGYSIQTADGAVDLPADRVKKVLWDHPPAATPGAASAAPIPTIPPRTTTPPIPGKKPKDPRMLQALLAEGEAAFANNEFTDARDSFTDALVLDDKNTLAGRGLGFAYIKLAKPTRAVKPLEVAALAPPLDRPLAMGLACALVQSHNPARAAKILKTYLESHPTPLDEPVVNALGIALSQVERSATRNTLFIDSVKLYMKLNAELEAAKPGKKRWGIEWLDAGVVDQKQKDRTKAQAKVDETYNKLQTANSDLQTAEDALSTAQNSSSRRQIRDNQIRQAQQQVNTATNNQQTAQNNYDTAVKALDDVPGPTFPPTIALDDVDFSLTPNNTIASAATPTTPVQPSLSEQASQPHKTQTPAPQPSPAPVVPVAPTHPAVTPPAATPNAATPTVASGTVASGTVASGTVASGSPGTANSAPTPAPKPVARHVTRYAAAFAIAPDILVTSAKTVESATSITVTTPSGNSMTASVLRTHQGDGLALLKLDTGTLPSLPLASSFDAPGALSCIGFPEVDLFNPIPKSMSVAAADQTDTWTVRFDTSPRVPGGPILKGNTVVGVELGDRDSDLAEVPAATLKALQSLIDTDAKASPAATDPRQAVVQVMAEH